MSTLPAKIRKVYFSNKLIIPLFADFFKGTAYEKKVYRQHNSFTEPFWDNLCPVCKKRFWSVSLDCACPKCGNYDLYVLNESKHLKHDAEELKKFHRKIMEDKEYEGNNDYEL